MLPPVRFRLPETHRFFYLASRFTDFWRRINIYWKDFMMKLVFTPCFPLRKRGENHGARSRHIVRVRHHVADHSYQWFWILGRGCFPGPTAVLALLGVLLSSTHYGSEARAKRHVACVARKRVRESLVVGVKAMLVFATDLHTVVSVGQPDAW